MPKRWIAPILFASAWAPLVLALAIAPAGAEGGSGADPPQTLGATTREQVRGVARSLLTARSKARPSTEAQQIRAELDRARTQLEALSAPIRRAPVVGAPSAAPGSRRARSWHEVRASQLSALARSLATLAESAHSLRAQRSGRPRSTATDASDASLRRIEGLQQEVSEALELPAAERRARLIAYENALRIGPRRPGPIREPEPAQAPALRNRTQHR